jgi:hypothetical protein
MIHTSFHVAFTVGRMGLDVSKAPYSFETLGIIHPSRLMPYDLNPQERRCENLASFNVVKTVCTPQRQPYYDVVVGLLWSNDPGSYACVSVATGRASHARRVKGNDPDKGHPSPPGWGMGVGLMSRGKKVLFRNLKICLG